jgi:hypothetical protein
MAHHNHIRIALQCTHRIFQRLACKQKLLQKKKDDAEKEKKKPFWTEEVSELMVNEDPPARSIATLKEVVVRVEGSKNTCAEILPESNAFPGVSCSAPSITKEEKKMSNSGWFDRSGTYLGQTASHS